MLTDEVKNSLKGLSQTQIKDKIRDGSISLPGKDTEEREEFLNLVAMTPEERDKALFPEGTGSSNVPPESAAPDKNASGEDSSKATNNEPEVPWWKADGYESEQAAVAAVKELRKTSATLQSTLDQVNAKEGKRGRELKELRKMVDELTKERDNYKEKTKPKIERPDRPVRPSPNDYEDGKLDDKYQEDLERYFDDFAEYNERLIEYQANQRIGEVSEQVTTIKKDFEQRFNTAQNHADPLEEVLKKDVPEFQKKFDLEMSVDPWTVNQAVLNLSSSDPVVKARAQKFVDSFPPADKAKWKKITDAINAAYVFDDNGEPTKRYRTIEGALFDQGLMDNYKIKTPDSYTPEEEKAMLEKRRIENQSSVAVPPAADNANADGPSSAASTTEEDIKRLRDLVAKYKAVINTSKQASFEATPEYDELKRLRQKVTGRLPTYMR